MKLNFTFKKTMRKLLNAKYIAITLIAGMVFIAGCYEFSSIGQPETGHTNSTFEVPLIVHEDDGGNDWTVPDLQNIGIFGVMIPEGWSVEDSIYYQIVSTDAEINNDGYLVYDTEYSQMLEDSIGSDEGYYWWGSITDREADMSYFDSLYFTPAIVTDDQVGTFYLRYAIGDQDYWDRHPADDISDPQPITITSAASVNEIEKELFSVYPNPSDGLINLNLTNAGRTIKIIEVYNLEGRMVKKLEGNQINRTIDMRSFSEGMYFMKMITEDDFVDTERILIK